METWSSMMRLFRISCGLLHDGDGCNPQGLDPAWKMRENPIPTCSRMLRQGWHPDRGSLKRQHPYFAPKTRQ